MSYSNTFITVAPDSIASTSKVPILNKHKKPIHVIEYEMLTKHPYKYGHKELIFEVYLKKEGIIHISKQEKQEIWDKLFSKGHPCLRASALTKRYGFGAHYNEEGKIAIYPIETEEYQSFIKNNAIKKIPAMRHKRQS